MALTYFTLTGYYAILIGSGEFPVSGDVTFTPLVGGPLPLSNLTPPSNLLLQPITMPLNQGYVRGSQGVQLVANSGLNLTGTLYYQVSFSALVARGRNLTIAPFNFTAPASAVTVDLSTLSPVMNAQSVQAAGTFVSTFGAQFIGASDASTALSYLGMNMTDGGAASAIYDVLASTDGGFASTVYSSATHFDGGTS